MKVRGSIVTPLIIFTWIVVLYSSMEFYFNRNLRTIHKEEDKIARLIVSEADSDLNIHFGNLMEFSDRVELYLNRSRQNPDNSKIEAIMADFKNGNSDLVDNISLLIPGKRFFYSGSGLLEMENVKMRAEVGQDIYHDKIEDSAAFELKKVNDRLVFVKLLYYGETLAGVIKISIFPEGLFKTIIKSANSNNFAFYISHKGDDSTYSIYGSGVIPKKNFYSKQLHLPVKNWYFDYYKKSGVTIGSFAAYAPWIVRLSSLFLLAIFLLYFHNRVKAERNLRLYKLLSENSKDVVWVYNADKQKYTYISPSVYLHRGISAGSAVNQKFTDSLTPESARFVNEMFQKRVHEFRKTLKQEEHLIEVQQIDSNGEKFWSEISYTLRINKKDEVEIIGNTRRTDIRKENEIALQRLNKELNAIALCEKSVLKSSSEREMLYEVCTIICNTLGYKFAWVGYAEQDRNKSVKPLAYSGVGREYMERAQITYDASRPEGRGPVGTSIRESKTVTCNDIEESKEMHPWIENAIKFGYNSIISIPLRIESIPFGALSVYSGTKNAFSPKEIVFLEKLADDLSFGINYVRIKEDNRATRERLKQVQALSGLFSWEFNLKSGICTLYENCEKVFGPSADNDSIYLETNFLSRLSAEDHSMVREAISQLANGEESVTREVRISMQDGSYIWLQNKMFPKMSNGQLSSVFVISYDVTESKKMSSDLQKMRLAVEQSPVSIVLTDKEGLIEYVNPMFCQSTGYTMSELIGANPSVLKSGTHDDTFYKELWNTIHSGKQWRGTFYNKRKDSTLYHESAIISPVTNEKGEITNFIAIKEYVTEKLKIENKLRDSEERFRAIVDNSITGITIIDEEGRAVFSNPANERIHGYSNSDIFGKHFSKILHPDDLELAEKTFREILSGVKTSHTEEFRLINKRRAKIIWVQVSISKFPNISNDQDGRLLLVFQDITSHKDLEERLKQSVNTRDKMFSIISHDLRGPIGNLLPLFEMFNQEDTDEEVRNELIREMKRTTATAYDLLENLLNWAKFQTKSIKLKPVNFDINNSISEVVSLYSSYANQKRITVSVHTGRSNFVFADPDSIHLVLRNIFYNAIKFTPKYGKISIKASPAGNMISVSIKDSGIGMTKEAARNIFNKDTFYTSYGTNNELGTGLGLQLCREFVQKNGGIIDVVSTVGKGSTFEFTLPAGKEVSNKIYDSTENFEPNENALSGRRVLLVEDDLFNLTFMSSLFEKWNIIFDVAENGRGALDRIQDRDYELVLMDLEMPVMNGISACQEMRNVLKLELPIVAMSANIDNETIEKIERAGFTDYISKPINPKLLFVKLAYRLKIKINSANGSGSSLTDTGRGASQLISIQNIKASFGEDVDIVKTMIDKFIEVSDSYYEGIVMGFENNDIELVKSISHKLKSSLGFFASDELSYEVRNINDLSADGYSERLADSVSYFKEWFPKLCEELKRFDVNNIIDEVH